LLVLCREKWLALSLTTYPVSSTLHPTRIEEILTKKWIQTSVFQHQIYA
jgi:hypothetical protein